MVAPLALGVAVNVMLPTASMASRDNRAAREHGRVETTVLPASMDEQGQKMQISRHFGFAQGGFHSG